MSDLSSKSRGLLDAARSARPTSAARERMSVALAARIGVVAIGAPPQPLPGAPAPLPASAPPIVAPPILPAPLASVAGVMSTAKAAVIGAVLGVAGVGAASAWPDTPQLPPPAILVAAAPSSSGARAVERAAPSSPVVDTASPTSVVEAAPPPLLEAPRAVEASLPAREQAPSRRAAAPASPSRAGETASPSTDSRAPALKQAPSAPLGAISIGEEIASLSEAQRSLKQGDGARAIAVLDELAARHPSGVLREERLAARVFALCAANRVEEAREAGQRFLAELPASVQAERVRASCAFSPGNPR